MYDARKIFRVQIRGDMLPAKCFHIYNMPLGAFVFRKKSCYNLIIL